VAVGREVVSYFCAPDYNQYAELKNLTYHFKVSVRVYKSTARVCCDHVQHPRAFS
jgi:hypothetical protein